MMHIRPFLDADVPAVEQLLDSAFGPTRHLRTAAMLRRDSHRLPELSFTLADPQAGLLGAVQCWPLDWTGADDDVRPLVLLGPLVVAPGVRSTGVGARLMEAACSALDRGHHSAMLIGDPSFYGRWGFSAAATGDWRLPGPVEPHRLLLRTSHPEDFAGAARIHPRPTLLEERRLRA